MTTQPDSVLKEIADMISKMVTNIESSVATTRGHYGDYMNLIHTVAKNDEICARRLGETLISAGANARGVCDALAAIYGQQ